MCIFWNDLIASIHKPFFQSASDRYLLATGGNDSLVKLWEISIVDELTAAATQSFQLVGHGGDITCVRFPLNSACILASTATDKTARIWDTVIEKIEFRKWKNLRQEPPSFPKFWKGSTPPFERYRRGRIPWYWWRWAPPPPYDINLKLLNLSILNNFYSLISCCFSEREFIFSWKKKNVQNIELYRMIMKCFKDDRLFSRKR